MSNEETLQEYNERLEENNVSLANVLTTINNLPEAGSGTSSSSDIYSTEERVIGVWIDGRPLYRRYIDYGNLSNTIKDINLTDYGIDANEVKFYEVYKRDPSGVMCNITPQFLAMNGGLICRVILYKDEWGTNILRIAAGDSNTSDLTKHTAYAILTYTKSTD